MLGLSFNLPRGRAPRILFIGAHADDIEIGCGGAALELIRRYPRATIHWLVMSGSPLRHREAQRSLRLLLGSARIKPDLQQFEESLFPSQLPAIKECLGNVRARVSPDVVFSHYGGDLHQDHRTLSEAVWNTFRDHFILEYEIPKFDGGLGSPGLFVPLPRQTVNRKISALMKAFESQHSKRWFTPDTFAGLMRLRGIECNAESGYAEAFYARKVVLGPSGARR